MEIIENFYLEGLTFSDVERKYNVSKETFRNYLKEQANERYETEFPKPEQQKNWFGKAVELIQNPVYKFIGSIGLSVTMFVCFYYSQIIVAKAKIDPIYNLLISSTFGAAALWLIVVTLANNLMFFSDIENFLYFLQGKKYFTKDYNEDLQNGLSTWERTSLNQNKRLIYVLLFAFLYWVIVRTYPTAATGF